MVGTYRRARGPCVLVIAPCLIGHLAVLAQDPPTACRRRIVHISVVRLLVVKLPPLLLLGLFVLAPLVVFAATAAAGTARPNQHFEVTFDLRREENEENKVDDTLGIITDGLEVEVEGTNKYKKQNRGLVGEHPMLRPGITETT